MASTLSGILDRLVTQLTEIDGAAPYTRDLSADEAIRLGAPSQSPATECAYITGANMNMESTFQAPLGLFNRHATIEIVFFVGATDLSQADRLKAACDMTDDCMTAIEADKTLNGQVIDLICTSATYDVDGGPYEGDCSVTVEAYWHTTTGM